MLRPGKTCDDGIALLNELTWTGVSSVNGIQNAVPRLNMTTWPEFLAAWQADVHSYDEWTGSAAGRLMTVFSDKEIAMRLRSERYGYIVSGDPNNPQIISLFHAELSELRTYFESTANELRKRKARYSRHQGKSLVLDTNGLLHYQRLDKIPWSTLYKGKICVVLPHVVIDEIDKKSYAVGEKFPRRARGVYRILEELIGNIDNDGFTKLPDETPLQILIDDPGHQRLANNDDEIVARAAYLKQNITPHDVAVVTRDQGMRTRAFAWGLTAEKLPDKYLIREDQLSARDLDEAMKTIEPQEPEQTNK